MFNFCRLCIHNNYGFEPSNSANFGGILTECPHYEEKMLTKWFFFTILDGG
jgi:hypothetical protein